MTALQCLTGFVRDFVVLERYASVSAVVSRLLEVPEECASVHVSLNDSGANFTCKLGGCCLV